MAGYQVRGCKCIKVRDGVKQTKKILPEIKRARAIYREKTCKYHCYISLRRLISEVERERETQIMVLSGCARKVCMY